LPCPSDPEELVGGAWRSNYQGILCDRNGWEADIPQFRETPN